MILAYSDEGLPIELDESTSEIIYKDTKVSFYVIKDAVESGIDRTQLSEKLDLTITDGFVTIGCLTLTKTLTNKLIKLSWKQLQQSKQFNKVGN
jgi:hypothetical protein